MSDDRVISLLERLDVAPVPDRPDQQEELWGLLEARLEEPQWRRLLHPRPALVAVGVTALCLAVSGVLWVSWGRRATEPAPIIEDPPVVEETPAEVGAPSTALEAVLDARDRWTRDPRPFHATVATVWEPADGPTVTSTREIWFAGDEAWRTTTEEIVAGKGTSFTYVWDGERELSLWPTGVDGGPSAELHTYLRDGKHVWGSPLDWTGTDLGTWWEQVCASGELITTEAILERPVDLVRCGGEQLWIDRETGLVLRHVWPEAAHRDAGMLEITSLIYGPALDPRLFDTTPPAGVPLLEQAEETSLRPGSSAPELRGRTLDGAPYEPTTGTDRLVVLWAPGVFDLGPLEQFHRDHPTRLDVVVVADTTDAPQATELAATFGYTLPIVVTDEVWTTWDPPQASFWVLVDADGIVAALTTGSLTPIELDIWLAENRR